MKTSDFDYELPAELIAQVPVEPRTASRLLVLDRESGETAHRGFADLPEYLREGDLLVFNDSRVIPARLRGKRDGSAGEVEILLLRRTGPNLWEVLVKPGKQVKPGAVIEISGGEGSTVTAEAVGTGAGGTRIMRFSDDALLPGLGQIPLPPYIHVPLADPRRYQTVYAREDGSAAAPTAGLHFTPEMLKEMEKKGVRSAFVTLHIGLDTFRPVREEDPLKHSIHKEYGFVSAYTADAVSAAKKEGRRVICVGTTSVRLLEAAAQDGELASYSGWVDLFITPSYQFRVTDALVTNFHLPRSTLLMLVSAFAGREQVLNAYAAAIERKYRFYSFGDAMLIL